MTVNRSCVPRIKYVLFDMDGTLLDTATNYFYLTKSLLAENFGKAYEWKDELRFMGMPLRDAVSSLIGDFSLDIEIPDYIVLFEKYFDRHFDRIEFLPGAERLVKHLSNHKVPLALATSSGSDAFDHKTKNHSELFSLFPIKILGDNPRVAKGKPHPDIFLEAKNSLLKSEAKDPTEIHQNSDTLVFEDSINGVLSGLSAGMYVVWIPDKLTDHTPFLNNDRVFILDSLEHFNPAAFGLVPFE